LAGEILSQNHFLGKLDFSHSLGLIRPEMKRLNLTFHSLAKPQMPA
jgi:hypothetical protein